MPHEIDHTKRLSVAFLWHMHQPNYREPGLNRLSMPWVRLHALKDYLDMPLLAASFHKVKVTFNLVPSLLDQIDLYLNGAIDRHLELSRMSAEELSPGLKVEILEIDSSGKIRLSITAAQRSEERADMDAYRKTQPKGGGSKGLGTLADLLKGKNLLGNKP